MTYGPGQFSGDLLMISGRKSIFRCTAVENGTLLEIAAVDLRALIGRDAELSDIFMNAFLARRGMLRGTGKGNVVIVGLKRSPETLAIREFLIRDGHPFGYLDLEADAVAQELLDRFSLGVEDIPIVFCNGELLRNPTPSKIAEAQHPYKMTLDDGQILATRAIVLATGAQYNKPLISNLDASDGRFLFSTP
jgi:thioredoxin reductase (NADPH)